jgi:hypothetical protein
MNRRNGSWLALSINQLTATAVTVRVALCGYRSIKNVAPSRRAGFSCDKGTFALLAGCDGSGGTGKPAVAYEAARSHARAAFYVLDCPALRRDIVRIVRTFHDG